MPKTMGESVLRGLRLEPDLARALKEYAKAQAKAHGGDPNLAAAARTLLREALKVAHGEHNCKREGFLAGFREAHLKIHEALK